MMAFQYLKKSKVRHRENVIFGSKPSCGQPSLEDKQYHHQQLCYQALTLWEMLASVRFYSVLTGKQGAEYWRQLSLQPGRYFLEVGMMYVTMCGVIHDAPLHG